MTVGKRIEDEYLQPGHFLGLKFSDGYYFMKILAREWSFLKYNLYYDTSTTTLATVTATSAWNDVQVSTSDARNQLAPEDSRRDQLYQIFYGISPSVAEVYTQYVSRMDRNSLIGTRAVPGDVGYVNGEQSPYNDPSVKTQMFTLNQLTPAFKAYNPSDYTITVYAAFHVMKYTYEPVKDTNIIREFMKSQRRVRLETMGGIDEGRILTAPSWLQTEYRNIPKPMELGAEGTLKIR